MLKFVTMYFSQAKFNSDFFDVVILPCQDISYLTFTRRYNYVNLHKDHPTLYDIYPIHIHILIWHLIQKYINFKFAWSKVSFYVLIYFYA